MQILNRSYKLATESPPTLSSSGLLFYPRDLRAAGRACSSASRARGASGRCGACPAAPGLVWAATLPVGDLRAHPEQEPALCPAPRFPPLRLAAAAGDRRARALRLAARSAPPAWPSARCRSRWRRLRPAAVSPSARRSSSPSWSRTRRWRRTGGTRRSSPRCCARPRAAGARVAVVPNDNYFSISNFRYEALRDGLPLRFLRALGRRALRGGRRHREDGRSGTGRRLREAGPHHARLEGGDPWLAVRVPVVAEVPLPDGSRGMVRVRRPPRWTTVERRGVLAARLAAAAAELPGGLRPRGHGLTVRHRAPAPRRCGAARWTRVIDRGRFRPGGRACARPPAAARSRRAAGRARPPLQSGPARRDRPPRGARSRAPLDRAPARGRGGSARLRARAEGAPPRHARAGGREWRARRRGARTAPR